MSQVAWSVYFGALPSGLSLAKDGRLVGTPTEPGSASLQVLAKYKTKSALASYSIETKAERHLANNAGVRSWEEGAIAQSCLEYRRPTYPYVYAGDTGDGLYRIAPNGQEQVDVYCDMSSEGGGWTRVALQYEGTPVVWTGATNGASYSLAQNQIPAHTHTGFGKDELATYVDYVQFKYTTSDIPVTSVTSPKTGKSYQIFRSMNSFYDNHDPERTYWPRQYMDYPPTDGVPSRIYWHNTLTIDEAGKLNAYTWAYSPHAAGRYQGFSLLGSRQNHPDLSGWSVWVR